MKRALAKANETIARRKGRAFVSRVAWLDLVDVVAKVHAEIENAGSAGSEMGRLYLLRQGDSLFSRESRVDALFCLSQVQVSFSERDLGVRHRAKKEEGNGWERVNESGATMWLSQDISGGVSVFVAPFRSSAFAVSESELIIRRYSCASQISPAQVRKLFRTFFRYCEATSAHGEVGLSGYVYRRWLRLNDIRFSSAIWQSVVRIAITTMLTGLSAAAAIATLRISLL